MLNDDDNLLLEYLESLEGANSLAEYIRIHRKGYSAPFHLMPLINLFGRIYNGEAIHACISVPPRHGKTESINTLIAKYIAMFPHKTVGYITYGANLAKSKSKTIRGIVIKLGITLVGKSLSEWRTVQGGGLICCGIGGAITGMGVDLMIIDDPIKNREEAESIVVKDKLEDWFSSTAYTRLEPGASVIINATRWAKDDLMGRIIDKNDGRWEIINLPAIDAAGDALWPARWPISALRSKEIEIGEYDFASLYQGEPIPKSGVCFREPAYYKFPNAIGARWTIGVDPAATEDTHADNSVITVCCATGQGDKQIVDVVYQYAAKIEIPDLVLKIKEISNNYEAPIFVESNGVGKAVAQMLRRIAPSLKIYEKASTTDKFTRALPTIAAWNTGRIRLPENEAWSKDLVKEASNFTAAGSGNYHDDRIDSLVVAFGAISRYGNTTYAKMN